MKTHQQNMRLKELLIQRTNIKIQQNTFLKKKWSLIIRSTKKRRISGTRMKTTNTEILEYFFHLEKDEQKKLVGFSLNDILVKIRMRDLLYISNYEFGVFEKEVKKALEERKSFIQLVRSG